VVRRARRYRETPRTAYTGAYIEAGIRRDDRPVRLRGVKYHFIIEGVIDEETGESKRVTGTRVIDGMLNPGDMLQVEFENYAGLVLILSIRRRSNLFELRCRPASEDEVGQPFPPETG
jgi:hypothetical protein